MKYLFALLVCTRIAAGRISDNNTHPAVLSQLHDLAGCTDGICATLAGDAVSPLLAGADECAQQEQADKIITAAGGQSPDVSQKMVALAVEYRQAERNTFPIFDVQPNVDRKSVFCQKAPQSPQLDGLVQAQSPAAPADLFFDPKVTTNGSTVLLGSAPNTIPFGQGGANSTQTGGEACDDGDGHHNVTGGDYGGQRSQSTQSNSQASSALAQTQTLFVTVTVMDGSTPTPSPAAGAPVTETDTITVSGATLAACSSPTAAPSLSPVSSDSDTSATPPPDTTSPTPTTVDAAAAVPTDEGVSVIGFASTVLSSPTIAKRTRVPLTPRPSREVKLPFTVQRLRKVRRQAADLGLSPVSSGTLATSSSVASDAASVTADSGLVFVTSDLGSVPSPTASATAGDLGIAPAASSPIATGQTASACQPAVADQTAASQTAAAGDLGPFVPLASQRF